MLAFLALVPRPVIYAALGLVAGVLVISGTYLYGKHEGRQQAAIEAAQATAKALKDRHHENANVDALDAVQLCVRLGGYPSDCETLKGSEAE